MKKRVSLFVCLLNLVPMLNANIGIKAMDPYIYKIDLNLRICSSSGFLKQYDEIKLEDKKNMMKKFKQSENWELQKEIKQDEYDYQTADSIDIFSYDGGKTNYVLKILSLREKESFKSEKLAFTKLNSCSELDEKCSNVFSPIHVGDYENNKTKVYYVVYEYAGENKRNSKNLSDKQKIKIWNDIVQKKCKALLFLLSKGIMHCDPNYNNWIIKYEGGEDNSAEVEVKLIDFGSCIDITNKPEVPLCYISPFYGNEPATNRELKYLLDSLSYDLCDLLSISHYKKDNANYGIFWEVKEHLDGFIKTKSEITLGNYKKLIGEMGNIIKDLSVI